LESGSITSGDSCTAPSIGIAFAAAWYLATLGTLCWTPGALAQSTRMHSVWDGVYTTQQARRGAALYARECAACHGPTLKERDGAPPLADPDFLAAWDGFSAGDLFERIRRTMPTAQPGKLSAQEYADILAHILGANQFPAGAAELDSRSEWLRQIRLEAIRPQKP
jgi:mono/diheme cytochrome c family protein